MNTRTATLGLADRKSLSGDFLEPMQTLVFLRFSGRDGWFRFINGFGTAASPGFFFPAGVARQSRIRFGHAPSARLANDAIPGVAPAGLESDSE